MVGDWPGATSPTGQVTVPAANVQVPLLFWADTKVSPAGNGSLTTTPRATDGPALFTDNTYPCGLPASGGSFTGALETDRSAEVPTVLVADAVRSAGVGSGVGEVRTAVFVRLAPAASRPGSAHG